VLSLRQIVEVNFLYLVDDLPQQLTRFHVVVGVFKHASDNGSLLSAVAPNLQTFERREKITIDEIKQRISG
jgi:hypothetical protein